MQDVTAFILAGGKSSRMGENKAFLMLDGRPLIDRAIKQAHGVADDIFIVGPKELYGAFGRIVADIYPHCGPLGGIHAALNRTRTDFSLVLALDTPFITQDFLHFLVEKAIQSPALVTAPKLQSGYQPLCAMYRSQFAAVAEAALKRGEYKIDALFNPEITQVIDQAVLEEAGFHPSIFDNLNSPEDFARATQQLAHSAKTT